MMVIIIYFELIAKSRTFIIVGLVYKCMFRVIDSVYSQHSLPLHCAVTQNGNAEISEVCSPQESIR